MNMPTLLNMPVSDGTKFQSMIAIIEAKIVQKPAFLLENLGARRAPITINEVPIASESAFCIAPRIAPI